MIIVLIGPPGSGKGTQGRLLSQKIHLPYVSVGDVLRQMMQIEDADGLLIKSHILTGRLVPIELVSSVLRKFLLKDEYKNGCILDGYPRGMEQSVFLEQNTKDDIKVIYFDVSDDIILKRILGRFNCDVCGEIYNSHFITPKVHNVCDICGSSDFVTRGDDEEALVQARLKTYRLETQPLMDHYNLTREVYNVDAAADPQEIETAIALYVKNQLTL